MNAARRPDAHLKKTMQCKDARGCSIGPTILRTRCYKAIPNDLHDVTCDISATRVALSQVDACSRQLSTNILSPGDGVLPRLLAPFESTLASSLFERICHTFLDPICR